MPDSLAATADSTSDPLGVATRRVGARLTATVSEPAEIVLSLAIASQVEGRSDAAVDEHLSVTVDEVELTPTVIVTAHGTRAHLLTDVPAGQLVVHYQATIRGELAAAQPDPAREAADRLIYLRPSRYCESDTLAAVAASHFHGLAGKDLLDAVSSWVGQRLFYLSGSSRPTDGAVQTYLAREGVCRDYAHLVVAFLRALGVPARLVAVYAPGLWPMDFHAVAEALVDGQWHIVDATTLASRPAMVRIATGRDASDTAFLSVHSGRVDLTGVEVNAAISPSLPIDDLTQLVRLP